LHILGGCTGERKEDLLTDMWCLDLTTFGWTLESPHRHGAWPLPAFFHSTVLTRVGAVTFGGVIDPTPGIAHEGGAPSWEARTSAVQVLPLGLPTLLDLCLHAVAKGGPDAIAEVTESGLMFPEHVTEGLTPPSAA
jgi:hypothetical protein